MDKLSPACSGTSTPRGNVLASHSPMSPESIKMTHRHRYGRRAGRAPSTAVSPNVRGQSKQVCAHSHAPSPVRTRPALCIQPSWVTEQRTWRCGRRGRSGQLLKDEACQASRSGGQEGDGARSRQSDTCRGLGVRTRRPGEHRKQGQGAEGQEPARRGVGSQDQLQMGLVHSGLWP